MEDCRIITPFYFQKIHGHYHRIGRLPYYYFLLLELHEDIVVLDWKTAVLLLPSTYCNWGKIGVRLEDCRIYTSFYSDWVRYSVMKIGILPYYYFLLLR